MRSTDATRATPQVRRTRLRTWRFLDMRRDPARAASRRPLEMLSTRATDGASVVCNQPKETMEFRLLGPVEARRDCRPIPTRAARSLARSSRCCCCSRTRSSRATACSRRSGPTGAGRGRAQPRRPGLAAAEGALAGRPLVDPGWRVRPRGRAGADRHAAVRGAARGRATREWRRRAGRGAADARRRSLALAGGRARRGRVRRLRARGGGAARRAAARSHRGTYRCGARARAP